MEKQQQRTGRDIGLLKTIIQSDITYLFYGGSKPSLAQIKAIINAFGQTAEYPFYDHEIKKISYEIYLRLIPKKD